MGRQRFARVGTVSAAAALAAALACTGGCEALGLGKKDKDRDQNVSRTPDRARTSVPAGVPSAASKVAGSDGGSRVQWVSDRAGTLYVADATDGRVLWSGPVRQSATVVVDPAAGAITVNDQQVPSSGPDKPRLDAKHGHALYFQPGSM
ncbi:MAG TPA: hypothetical protein VF796_03275 [Humisphaera sp.]